MSNVKANHASSFELKLSLSSNARSITPLSIEKYKNTNSNGNSTNSIEFNYEVAGSYVDELEVTISNDNGGIYQKKLADQECRIGKHTWKWDGFSNNGILDTKLLKSSGIKITLKAGLEGIFKSQTIRLNVSSAEQKWVDVIVNKPSKRALIELRANIKDGGSNGVGELPPEEAKSSPHYIRSTLSDPRRSIHIRNKTAADLKSMALSGISKYWSRNITDLSGAVYVATTNAVNSTNNAMDDIDVSYNTNRAWSRSSNPGSVRGFYSLFGNFVSERISYNIGWLEYPNGWFYQPATYADKQFIETSAHEIGHEILSAYGGDSYSYGHRGSSTIITQSTKKLSDGGLSYPASGEIDLMKYYNGRRPRDFYSRAIASEQDVKSLLWLARIEFND